METKKLVASGFFAGDNIWFFDGERKMQ